METIHRHAPSRHSTLTFILATTLFSHFLSQAHAYLITVDAGIENECFHEKVPIGTKLGFSFEVVEGGFYDIDVEIKDPADVILHRDERSSNGKFTIEATMDGAYKFCFNNKLASFAPKMVIFDIDKAEPNAKASTDASQTGASGSAESKPGDDSETSKLEAMVEHLMLSTISARHDVRYLMARDRIHRRVNEQTNNTIMWWSAVEFILLLGVTVGQVLYLKRFFEIRRKV